MMKSGSLAQSYKRGFQIGLAGGPEIACPYSAESPSEWGRKHYKYWMKGYRDGQEQRENRQNQVDEGQLEGGSHGA